MRTKKWDEMAISTKSQIGAKVRGNLLGLILKNQHSRGFEDFFTLWKDADPDIPILKQAKAEYSKLQ